ncbi:MAG: flagellar hook-length control protein FliK [Selenomonadaceae bacterium]|nr:flagellar hook-length control protein FliK [Selenomonadaceae bacterium]
MAYSNNVNLFSNAPINKVNVVNISQKAAAKRGEYVSRQTTKTNDFGSQLDKASAKMDDSTKYTKDTVESKTQQTAKTESNVQKSDVKSDNVQKEDVQAVKAETDSTVKDGAVSTEETVAEVTDKDVVSDESNMVDENGVLTAFIFPYVDQNGNLDYIFGPIHEVEMKAAAIVKEAMQAAGMALPADSKNGTVLTKEMMEFMQARVDEAMAELQGTQLQTNQALKMINLAKENGRLFVPEGFTPVEETTVQQPMAMEALLGNTTANEAKGMDNMLNMLSSGTNFVRATVQTEAKAGNTVQAENNTALTNLLGTETEITVETQPQSQFGQQFNQSQQFNANQQFNQPQQTPVVNAAGEVQPMQMPGQAAFDVAPVTDSSQNADTSSVAGANFQQFNMVNEAENTQQVQQPQQANTDYNIPKQIVEQARLIKAGENTEMVMKLNPEHLGQLSLKVSINGNGGVTATFHSDSATVRGIIETSMIQLKNELAEQGLKVDRIEVSAQLPNEQMPQDMGQGYYAQQQGSGQQKRTGNASDLANYEEDGEVSVADGVPVNASTEPIRDQQGNVISDGVDYKV